MRSWCVHRLDRRSSSGRAPAVARSSTTAIDSPRWRREPRRARSSRSPVEHGLDDAEVLGDRAVDALLGEEVVHAHDADALVDDAEHARPAPRCRPPRPGGRGTTRRAARSSGSGSGVSRRSARHSSRSGSRTAASWRGAELDRPGQGLQLERPPHLVEVADLEQVGADGRVAAVGVALDEPLGVQADQRLADRRAGDRRAARPGAPRRGAPAAGTRPRAGAASARRRRARRPAPRYSPTLYTALDPCGHARSACVDRVS